MIIWGVSVDGEEVQGVSPGGQGDKEAPEQGAARKEGRPGAPKAGEERVSGTNALLWQMLLMAWSSNDVLL